LSAARDKTQSWLLPPTLLAALLTLVLLIPIFDRGWRDAFPLSNYPMFTSPRKEVSAYSLVVVAKGGPVQADDRTLPPAALGISEVMQAFVSLARAHRGGPDAMSSICQQVDANLREDRPDAAHEVAIVHLRFSPMRYLEDGEQALSRDVVFRCPNQEKTTP
jgi:hypothetical protein